MKHTDFYNTVDLLGEVISFGGEKFKASLKSSTEAVYNLANRAYYVQGQAFAGNYGTGDYFTREIEPEELYMLATVKPDPHAADLRFIYGIRCNCKAVIMRYKGRDADDSGNITDLFEEAYDDVRALFSVTTRSGKQTNDGLIDQTIYSLILPHKYMLSVGDRLILPSNVGGESKDTPYFVESVGNDISDAGGYGIDTAQLSLDTRS